jgi:1A family penicillin-binding protein
MLLAAVVVVLVGAALYHHYSQGLPDIHHIGLNPSFETTRIYARDGHTLLYELADPATGRRTRVDFDRIPNTLKQATIAVEDANFYQHPGVDWRGIVRAMWLNYRNQEIVSGGSTITQQLVRALLLSHEAQSNEVSDSQRYERKMREIILAYRVNQEYSKDEILNHYLNEVYYGAQSYGVEAAARSYFNKHVWQLSDAEATLLAGLPQSPTLLNPFDNMEGARARQAITLDLMVKNGALSAERAEAIKAEPITLVTPTVTIYAPHFVFYVRDLLEQRYSSRILYRGGLRIITSLDINWQIKAEQIVRKHIEQLRAHNAHNAAVVMLSPTGEILAMVGSADYNDPTIDGQVNVALAPRQPGSALKPIVYAAALQRGWTPATIIWDVPTEFQRDNGAVYAPMNYDNSWHGPQRVRMALANSLNIPAVKALEFVGIETFVNQAQRMGITTMGNPARYGLAMALGSNEVRLLDLSTAYTTFRNGGYYHPHVSILRIEDSQGAVLERQPEAPGPQVLGPRGEQIAFLISNILSDNQARWYMFGRGNVMELPDNRPSAVKTGTSNEWRDSWAVGYTPYVTIGVWVGNSDNSPMQEIAGSNGAGLIWRDLMVAYHLGLPPQHFARPEGIVERSICAGTGTRPDDSCPHVIQELFVAGMEPPPSEVTYRAVRVAGDGSCLAAPYSPASEVRTVQFAVYPPEFRNWAAHNGVPQPPTHPCPQPAAPDQAVALIHPINPTGQITTSQVFIQGTARYPYDLEIGAGASPQSWNLINRNTSTVENGVLGIWEATNTPPGDYLIRLRVHMPDGLTLETTRAVRVE